MDEPGSLVDQAAEAPVRRTPRPLVLALLVVVFIASRLIGGWFADHPERWRNGGLAVGDVSLYQSWADEMVDGHRSAYVDVGIPYPPGLLPFIVAPRYTEAVAPYSSVFIKLMELVDAAGLIGLVLIARRRGSWIGPWAWTILIPLLGPIAWTRLDLVPAVATIFALERAEAGGWTAAGGWLGFGAIAKVYPAFLLPATVIASARRSKTLIAAGVAMATPMIALVGSLSAVYDSIARFHWRRGLQLESVWSSGLLLAHHAGYPVRVFNVAGAMEVGGGIAGALRTTSFALGLVVIALGALIAWRRVSRGDVRGLSLVLLGTLALLTGVGTIFSPQYLIWIFALAAVAAVVGSRGALIPVALLVPTAILTQIVFPFLYGELIRGELLPTILLAIRNVLTLAVGIVALRLAWKSGAPPAREPA
jgi:hypothetical protein